MQRADLGPTMYRAVMATRTQRFVSVVLVVLMLDGGAAQGSAETSRWSHGNVSYHVFSFNDTAGDTWATANEQCEVHGLHLTAVWDQDTQDAVNAAPLLADTVDAWLAGRRSNNDTFMRLNGQLFRENSQYPGLDGVVSHGQSGTCGYTQGSRTAFQSCSVRYNCLCERQTDHDCPFDEVLHGNKCIWSSSSTASWYNCRNWCREGGGDLVSLSYNVAKVIDGLKDITGLDHSRMYLWVGVHRRPWHWVSGTGQLSSVYTAMGYYDFGPNNGSAPNNKCLFVNMGAHDRTWVDSPCHAKLRAFMCDDGPAPDIADQSTPRGDGYLFNEETSRWCHGNVCYHVFSFNDTNGDTWTTANEHCEVHGLHLTAVWDQDTQDAVNAAPPLADTVNAWLAGRRSDNDTFMRLNGQLFRDNSERRGFYGVVSHGQSGTCGYTQRGRTAFQSCSVRYNCLCERQTDHDCPFDEVLHGDKCIWSSSPAASWYNCRNRCREGDGDLSSLSYDVAKVNDGLKDMTGLDHSRMYLWVGLHRRPWHWVSGTGQLSSVHTPMGYYHFGPNNGSSPNNKCLFVNMGAHDRTWVAAPCHAKLGAFMCDDGLVPVIASSPAPGIGDLTTPRVIADQTTPSDAYLFNEKTWRWCHGNVCYNVFSFNDTAGDTWTTANEQCEVHGLHLTAVWDQNTQDALDAAPPLADTVDAWLAGRRSDNNALMWLNGKLVTGYQGSVPRSGTCGCTYRYKTTIQSCSTHYNCLCERKKDPDCPFDEVLHGDKCIWSSSPADTWYNCRNRCIAAGGDLASLSDNVVKVIQGLNDKTGLNIYNMYLWVGVHRWPWHWVSGTGQLSSVYTPMGYYHFGPNNGSSPNNKCIFVNMGAHDRTWVDAPCHAKFGAFMCDDGPVPVVAEQTTLTGPEPVVAEQTTRAGSVQVIADETTPIDDHHLGLSVGGATGLAVAFVVLAAAVINLSVCLCRGRPKGFTGSSISVLYKKSNNNI